VINELRRALCKKSNLIIIGLVMALMAVNAFYNGWSTALRAEGSSDLTDPTAVEFYKNYFGNTFRVWRGSYYMVQALAPIILVAPYISSYMSEKNNRFRFFCVSRKGRKKYIFDKVFAIAIAGVVVLGAAELLFGIITGIFTAHDYNLKFLENIVSYREDVFFKSPMAYFGKVYASHLLYYFSFLIFAVGITAYIKNKIAIIVIPFVAVGLLDMVLPQNLQPNVVMQPYVPLFSPIGYIVLILGYVIVGIASITVFEMLYMKKGN